MKPRQPDKEVIKEVGVWTEGQLFSRELETRKRQPLTKMPSEAKGETDLPPPPLVLPTLVELKQKGKRAWDILCNGNAEKGKKGRIITLRVNQQVSTTSVLASSTKEDKRC